MSTKVSLSPEKEIHGHAVKKIKRYPRVDIRVFL